MTMLPIEPVAGFARDPATGKDALHHIVGVISAEGNVIPRFVAMRFRRDIDEVVPVIVDSFRPIKIRPETDSETSPRHLWLQRRDIEAA